MNAGTLHAEELADMLLQLSGDRPLSLRSVAVNSDRDDGAEVISIEFMSHGEPTGWTRASVLTPPDDREVLVCRDGKVSSANYWGPVDGWSISPPPTFWMKMPRGVA